MPSLRIKFPEKDEASVIVLRGDRITVGRRPDNTVQILDRTVSAFHAELVLENGHYRLHDTGSANGTFVNGAAVRDFHLRESCKVTFGTVECEFDAAEVKNDSQGLATHGELAAALSHNDALKAQLEMVRTELAALRTQSPLNAGGASTVPREEFEKVVLDRASLSERLHRSESQLSKLREEVAILRRDRENLELAAESARTEMERLRSTVVKAKAVPAPQAAIPVAVPAAAPAPAMPNLPPPSSLPQPSAVPKAVPVAATAPKSPTAAGMAASMSPATRPAPPPGVLPGAGKMPLKPYARPAAVETKAPVARDPRLQPEPEGQSDA